MKVQIAMAGNADLSEAQKEYRAFIRERLKERGLKHPFDGDVDTVADFFAGLSEEWQKHKHDKGIETVSAASNPDKEKLKQTLSRIKGTRRSIQTRVKQLEKKLESIANQVRKIREKIKATQDKDKKLKLQAGLKNYTAQATRCRQMISGLNQHVKHSTKELKKVEKKIEDLKSKKNT